MKAFVMKVETAQRSTQWYRRTPTSSRYREPVRPYFTHSKNTLLQTTFLWIEGTYREPSTTKGAKQRREKKGSHRNEPRSSNLPQK